MSDSVNRRDQIIGIALRAFSQSGYHNTSMNDIAEALGVTKPVLYQYFDSKRSLYLELLHFVGEDLLRSVTQPVTQESDPRAQTERAMVAFFTWVSNNRDAFALLFESSGRVDDEFADIVSEFEVAAADAIAPFIAAKVSPAEQRLYAIGLVGMAETVSRQIIREKRLFEPQQLGETLARLAWAGLRSLGQER